MIITDPPFEMSGGQIYKILSCFDYEHLLLITSMHQLIEFAKHTDLQFCFDLVVSHISPKKSKSYHQPNYVHSNIVYFRKKGVASAFDRRKVMRQDHYSDTKTHYYPTLFISPKTDLAYKYQKNQAMMNDLVGAFNVKSVLDPFAGSGTTAIACLEHDIDCTLIECDSSAFDIAKQQLSLLAYHLEVIQ